MGIGLRWSPFQGGAISARLQREAAAESFRVVQLRFEDGRDPLTRYLQAELALFEAESTLRAQ